jgi:hypothetical protein
MRASERKTAAAMLLILGILGAGLGAVPIAPAGCLDGCDETETETGDADCADCPLCSPGRAPVLLGKPEGAVSAGTVTAFEPPLVRHPSRTEDRDVFHVPRHLA